MPERSGSVCETLHDDGEFVLSRVVMEGRPTLRLAPASDHLAPESLQRLEHEYRLREELAPTWAARPRTLTRNRGRPMLLLDDPGGELLVRLIGKPWDVTPFLRVAISLAIGLGRLHQQGLVHKNIKPANILVNRLTGEVWFTGFSIASRLPRERQAPEPPAVISGTLPYIAPEQTGRMNRSIDSRSDLYSLGVTLYEMLTGTLPFTASDPMEWIHCHIARQPMPPDERVEKIPAPVSQIIMKLLTKTAEERYQTAAGLEADLRKCLAEWESRGAIDPFPLGAHDASDRLLIPEKLYGRAREVETLLASFDRIVKSGGPELVLVSGYSGIGKSAVVNELHKALVPSRGLFTSGKFDQQKRDIPYRTIAQAFQGLIRGFMSKSDAELEGWRRPLREALGAHGRLVVELVPELELIIGEQPPAPDLPPQQARRLFHNALQRFVGAFAKPEHPLVLFLDDLHWVDAATLDLLEDLMIRSDLHHLLVIAAYRDNEIDPTHPLVRKLDAIRDAGAKVGQITLAPLGHEHLEELVADALRCAPARAIPLAQLVHQKTGGNPFFVIRFLSALADESLVAFDPTAGGWSWNLDCVRAKGYTENVVELMVSKLSQLPTETQTALQQLACLGNAATTVMLATVLATSEDHIHTALWDAARHDLVERRDGSYRFIHDWIQEAAYSSIPDSQRAKAHLRIGRLIVARTPPEKRDEAIFEIVNQLNRGLGLITSLDEREQVAEFNLIAGQRASASTAYASALRYFITGRDLLAEDCWEHRRELIFTLDLRRAECELLTGALSDAENHFAALSARTLDTADRAGVARLGIDLYSTLNQNSRSVAVGLEYLRHIGLSWSPHPTDEEARRAYERVSSELGRRTSEELIALPLMTDLTSLATLDVLNRLSSPAQYTDLNLYTLCACHMLCLTLDYGNGDASAVAYGRLGMIAGLRFGEYENAYRVGQLAYELVERLGLQRFQAGVYLNFGNMIMPWTRHIRACCKLMGRAFDVAQKTGDLVYAGICSGLRILNLLSVGDPLADIQREAESALAFAQKVQFGPSLETIPVALAIMRMLRGATARFGSLDDGLVDEQRIEHGFANTKDVTAAQCWYWVCKLQARFMAGEYATALDASSQAQRLLSMSLTIMEAADYHFYSALSHAAFCDSASTVQRTSNLEALAAHYRQLASWAATCPENFEDRAALVGAEIARIEGRVIEAEQLYEQAIRSAHTNGFVHNEALANELAARFYTARGFKKIAHAYLQDARYGYHLWGAVGKVRQLDQLYPHLGEQELASGPMSTIGASVEHLDLATVIKVSQAVSGEIVLEKLIDTLIRTAIEHAGAERGLLILLRGDAVRIEAEATTARDGIEVRLRQTGGTPLALPESILHYVLRTQESIILDDASVENLFSTDEYLRQHRLRSVLCLPVVKQAKPIGVLYLENTLTSHVFTPERIVVLKLLASQAAISLENARLYTEVREAEEKVRRAERELRRVVDTVPALTWTTLPDGANDFCNQGWLDYTGLSSADTQGFGWTVAFHPEDLSAHRDKWRHVVATGEVFENEARLRRADGEYRWFLHRAVPLRDGVGHIVKWFGTSTDIEDRRQVERVRAEQAQQVAVRADVSAALSKSADLREILRGCVEAIVRHLGAAFARIWTLSEEGNTLELQASAGLYTHLDGPHSRIAVGQLKIGLIAAERKPHLTNDVTSDPRVTDQVWARHEGMVAFAGYPLLVEERLVGVMAMFACARLSAATLDTLASVADVIAQGIERKRAEAALHQAQAELAHVNRVATLGELMASIAHEINQPLAAVVNNASACLRWLAARNLEEARQSAALVVADGHRAGEIVARIRALVKKAPLQKERLDINETIREVIALVRSEVQRNGIELETHLSDEGHDAPLILADRIQLQQVLLNLIMNAVEAMSGDGDGPRELVVRSGAEDSQRVLVAVRDSGPGLDLQSVERLFDAFYTTKPHGLGMGLAISRSIIEAHGGRLWAEANEGRGATFQFTLPTGGERA